MECDTKMKIFVIIHWTIIVAAIYIIRKSIFTFVKTHRRLKIRPCNSIPFKCYITKRVRPYWQPIHIIQRLIIFIAIKIFVFLRYSVM